MSTANEACGTLSGRDACLLAASCAATLATLIPVALFQTGAAHSLSDPPPSAWFDSERITSSRTAHPLGIPDSLLGIASFTATLCLIAAARRNRNAKALLGGKLALDASMAAVNVGRQITAFGKLCSWCTGTALTVGVTTWLGRRVIRQSARSLLE